MLNYLRSLNTKKIIQTMFNDIVYLAPVCLVKLYNTMKSYID